MMTTTATISMQKAAKSAHFLSSQADRNLTFAAFVRNAINPNKYWRHAGMNALEACRATPAQWLALHTSGSPSIRMTQPGFGWTRRADIAGDERSRSPKAVPYGTTFAAALAVRGVALQTRGPVVG